MKLANCVMVRVVVPIVELTSMRIVKHAVVTVNAPSVVEQVSYKDIHIDMRYKHVKYGVRCSYCDTKWPCDPIRCAERIEELLVAIARMRKQALTVSTVEVWTG
jgi:hypothetical protein